MDSRAMKTALRGVKHAERRAFARSQGFRCDTCRTKHGRDCSEPAHWGISLLRAAVAALVPKGGEPVDVESIKRAVLEAVEADRVKRLAGLTEKLEAEIADQVRRAFAANHPAPEMRIVLPSGKTKKIRGTTHAAFKQVLSLAHARIPILLVGPAGTGKTYLAEQIAKALGLRFGFLSCSIGLSEGAVMGRLLPTGEGGAFEYTPSEFVRCYEEGGVFLFDEMDAADPNTLTKLNAALAGEQMALDARVANPIAKRHADFVCIAACNTFGTGGNREYSGRNQLDQATLNRFQMGTVCVDYDRALEQRLLDANGESGQWWREWGWAVRDAIRARGLKRCLSTRDMINATKAEAAGSERADVIAGYFASWKDDERAKIPAECVNVKGGN